PKDTFKTLEIAIKSLKEYIEGERFDKFVDESFHLIYNTYTDLKKDEQSKKLSPAQSEMLSILEPLKEIGVVQDPPPLSEQFIQGGVDWYMKQKDKLQSSEKASTSSQSNTKIENVPKTPEQRLLARAGLAGHLDNNGKLDKSVLTEELKASLKNLG